MLRFETGKETDCHSFTIFFNFYPGKKRKVWRVSGKSRTVQTRAVHMILKDSHTYRVEVPMLDYPKPIAI